MPKILKIVTNPNQILRKVSKEFDISNISKKESQTLFDNMELTMVKKDGVGLAAPQIGKNIRIIILNTKEGLICAINPQITKKSILQEWDEEGCLSVPETFGKVKRHKNVNCVFYDRAGKKQILKAKGFLARIIQHEIDHLDGILFIDKAKNIKCIKPF